MYNSAHLQFTVSQMDINSILVPERTVARLAAGSKKRAIELASRHIVSALPHLEATEVYRALIEREKLGTTAIGEGAAIPHCRLRSCRTIIGGLFVCEQGLDFSAWDEIPVRIMFVLLVPESEESEHVHTLGMLAKRLQSAEYRQRLLDAPDNQALYEAAIADIGTAENADTGTAKNADTGAAKNADTGAAKNADTGAAKNAAIGTAKNAAEEAAGVANVSLSAGEQN